MKNLKIGTTKIRIAESIEDLNIKRWNAVKAHILEVENGVSVPSLKETFMRLSSQFDKNSASGMYREIYNFIHGLSQVERKSDPDQMVFALLTLEEGEDPTNTDTTMLLDKMERLAAAGLTQGTVAKEVENFISGLIRR